MNKKFQIALVGTLLFFLTGCQLFKEEHSDRNQIGTDSVQPSPADGYIPNWPNTLSLLITEMTKAPQPAGNRSLLIGDIINNTGQMLPMNQINALLHEQVLSQSQYSVVDKISLDAAKQALGLPMNESRVSRSKMIALGRYLKTDLILFSSIEEARADVGGPLRVSMELLSTKTGEIIWKKTNQPVLTETE